ncbi:unnamed protein product [Rotaria sp. Silwood1]|nr:unnamed protein product [Rotaria sp. Silwood1]CAF0836589.1 unnamed protein product [Rotaria sp. Silwood1]CAF3366924.1 unnamed protein product [Rotaria sp. Silwood1]CAF4592765.1 unnamed protein product [Rotaria sp. Silwood1]
MIRARARPRQDPKSSSFSSTCTSASSNPQWSDASSSSPINHNLLSPQRPTLRFTRRFILPIVPAARLPISPTSPRAALRDLCSPRQEPRPPADVLNRSYLDSCSPSLAKFSRTMISQHASASSNTTVLPPSTICARNFLHPTIPYLTVNARGLNPHHHHYRHTR